MNYRLDIRYWFGKSDRLKWVLIQIINIIIRKLLNNYFYMNFYHPFLYTTFYLVNTEKLILGSNLAYQSFTNSYTRLSATSNCYLAIKNISISPGESVRIRNGICESYLESRLLSRTASKLPGDFHGITTIHRSI